MENDSIENTKKNEKVIYEEISRLEAMTIIDSGKIDNLYFVGVYWDRGNRDYYQPRERKQTEPIKYLSQTIIESNRLFKKFETVKATPENYIKETNSIGRAYHKWFLKIAELDLRLKPPIKNLNKCFEEAKRGFREAERGFIDG